MFGQKYEDAQKGHITRRCKAVTPSGPCKNWTSFGDFCNSHEWRAQQAVLSTRQSFVLLFPKAIERLARVIDEPDSEVALKGIMVTLKYMLGDKLATDGMNVNELEHLTQEELIAKASRAIAALQEPHPPSGDGQPGGSAVAAAASETTSDGPQSGTPPALVASAGPGAGAVQTAPTGLSEPPS